MFIIFDTETTGLPKDFNRPYTDTDNWPRLVQLAWQIHDDQGALVEVKNFIVKPEGFSIPFNAEKIHGISTKRAQEQGVELSYVLNEFNTALAKCNYNVGHNIGFDINIMGCEYVRTEISTPLHDLKFVDTKSEAAAEYCMIPGGRGGKYKWPTLTELHQKLFNEGFNEAHNASADVEATARCFLEMVRIGIVTDADLGLGPAFFTNFRKVNDTPFELIGLNIQPYNPNELVEGEQKKDTEVDASSTIKADTSVAIDEVDFFHLHNHSQYSILQSTTQIDALVKAAIKNNMPAVGLTDLGNMMAAFHFMKAVNGHNKKIKEEKEVAEAEGKPFNKKPLIPIVGCELNFVDDHLDKSKKDNGYQIPLLAKNKKGYHNIAKMSSEAFINGFYYVPRISKSYVAAHAGDIICTTGGLLGEVPNLILNVGEEQAEKAFLWYKEIFGDDFYIELNRHGLEEEDHVNRILLEFGQKHNVKCIAANNTFYLNKEDANAHDILLCVKEGEKKSTPIGRGRGFRFGFPNDEFYFKSQEEMKKLFKDLPQAIANLKEIKDKITPFDLASDVLLPAFDIPEEFIDPEDEKDGGKRGENAFLRHLTYEGAKKRYGEITDEISERLDFELATIANTGYPGYFLIVQDFTTAARGMGVAVGPGRGSAAGSAVAYCVGITNVDPIAYDLLFERFLNPDRVSLPDIDIDFDDEGRGRVIDYVIEKYGSSQVAQIITYGTMAAKSSIRDTGRVLDLPLPDTDKIAKLVPDMKLKKLFGMNEEQLSQKLNPEQMVLAQQLKRIYDQSDLEGQTLRQAHVLEGSVRNTGIHACGVIITPSDIREHVPVAVSKDANLWCTQFDNSVVESAGLLKMDFLGLKTLTLIKDAIAIIKERHGIEIDPDEIPLDDVKTYELFQRGETVGVFQYESTGMQKYLKELKPTVFADLIAMNALYRPGPLEYIPSFIRRKHGLEPITYDLEPMKEYLEETYGITVYQEQVMLLSQKLAGFSKGEADMLRKAMGKKILSLLEKMKPKFINGGKERGHNEKTLEKIWKDWEAFASYAFNKSHSTCYAWIAFQTAYLKAHYPAEYMASVLSNNMNDIKQVTFFMEECRRMGTPVLGPDVNESVYKFTVNKKGEIRFGLGAIKGVGEGAVDAIVHERKDNGPYIDIFDLTERINLRAANKKCIESLTLAGGLDCFDKVHRAQYFYKKDDKDVPFIEKAIKYGQKKQSDEDSNQASLFEMSDDVEMPRPPVPPCPEWSNIEKLNKERDVVGIFISGHPLDDFKLEINNFCSNSIGDLKDLEPLSGKEVSFAGIVVEAAERMTKKGDPFGILTVEDYEESKSFYLFGEDYLKFRVYLVQGAFLYLTGKIQKNKWKDELEVKIIQLSLLSQVREKYTKSITVNLDLNLLNEANVGQLENLIKEYSGNCQLKLGIYDMEEKMKVMMASRTFRVDPTNQFFKEIEKMSAISYHIN